MPKDLSSPELNEDEYRIDKDRSLMVLCDGASESFDSKKWAAILADKFLNEQAIDPDWIDDVLSSYRAPFDCQEMSWSKRAAYERGSFSTLLGIKYSPSDNSVEIIGIGDTMALLLNDNEIIDSFPYTSAKEFEKRPQLLSTNSEHNSFLFSPNFMTLHKKIWRLDRENNTRLLFMTDALAEWTLRGGRIENSSLCKLLQIGTDKELEDLVLSERSMKKMRLDDTTLVNVIFTGG